MSQLMKATIFDRKGNVLAIGFNSYSKTHPLQFKLACKCGNPDRSYLHAEIDAIRKLKSNTDYAYRIYVERYFKNGKPALAKPCEICQLAIKKVKIKHIEYTVQNV